MDKILSMRYIYYILIFVILISCRPKKKESVVPIIPEDKFVKILVDYHLAEGVQISTFFINKTKKVVEVSLCDTLLKNDGYNRAIFDSTISFYAKDPEKYDLIYEKVITELNKRQAKLENSQKKKRPGKEKLPI